MKPPFSYCGGKQRIVSKIIPHIPRHTVYAEPFCGGATLLFQKPDYTTGNNHHYREAINDTDSDIYNFFCVLRDRKKELIERLEAMPYSQQEHRNACRYSGDDDLLRAYYFFVNIMQSFAHKKSSGWGTGVFSKNLSSTYLNKIDCLNDCADRLKKVHLANEDALRFIDRWDSPNTFFYCDPPYPNTGVSYTNKYTQEDFELLVDKLDRCQGSFILSCYDNPAPLKEWKKVEINALMTASRNKTVNTKIKECLWIREAKEKPCPEIIKIYERQMAKESQMVMF